MTIMKMSRTEVVIYITVKYICILRYHSEYLPRISLYEWITMKVIVETAYCMLYSIYCMYNILFHKFRKHMKKGSVTLDSKLSMEGFHISKECLNELKNKQVFLTH